MNKTKIDWADYTWNPVSGCKKVSEGCRHCYAERHALRFWGDRKFSDVLCHPEKLDEPMQVKEPALIFINSMSDLFLSDVPGEFILSVMRVVKECPRHTFLLLTKRPKIMKEFLSHLWIKDDHLEYYPMANKEHALPNLWIGVSVEDQESANNRIPLLLETPGILRFVSVEPMLGPMDLEKITQRIRIYNVLNGSLLIQTATQSMALPNQPTIDWVICGGESGTGARPMKEEWAEDLRDQCVKYRTPFFFKQWGGGRKKGHLIDGIEWHQWPVITNG